ncbi:MATE family efflux transporter [Hespellia stercorisuis]|nr:MATE family efflux transporter [Hespellia stercorisuis]
MQKKKKDRSQYLFDNRALVVLIIPLIIEQFLAVLVGMADSIMIASVGEAAVSGVSLVDQIMVLFIALFSALATGGAVVAGQYLGMKNEKLACRASTQLVWFITISATVIMVVIYACKYFILHVIFGPIEADVRAHANTYLMIVAASIPFMALYNGGAAIFRAEGNSKLPMKVSILMNVINVGGNALLIYGFHRGTEGVAIPTLVSRVVAAVVVVALLCREKYPLHIERSLRYKPDGRMIRRIMSIGVPNGMENSMFQIGKILVLSLVSSFGTYAIAANAVCNAVAMFEILPGMAIALAMTTVIARCVGAGEDEQVRYYTKKLVFLTYVGMWVFSILTLAFLPMILRAYNLSDITAQTATKIMIFHSVSCMLIWPISFALPATLRAAGDAQVTMWISIASMWLFRIGASYVLGKFMGWGVFGVWVAMVIDWCFRAVMMLWRYLSGKWRGKRAV